jgi:ribosomal protein S18 acetylase RimI-like enzyme
MPAVRPAQEGDAERIAEVHVRSWQAAYRPILPGEFLDSMSAAERAPRWRARIQAGDSVILVIEDEEGVLAGFVTLGPGPKSGIGELYAIYLDPACWDQGWGRELMVEAERHLVLGGYEEAVLWVFADNRRARGFYERAGWSADGGLRIEEIGGVQPQQVRYRRSLGQPAQPPSPQ